MASEPRVTCSECGRVIGGYRPMSQTRGHVDLYPRAHKDRFGLPCRGSKLPAELATATPAEKGE